jgi:aspartate/methionine/tyrosine aminotransferase
VLKPTAVNSILAEARALMAQGRELVPLMRGEPDFSTPLHIVDAAVASLREGRTQYPDNRGELRLREAVAAKLMRTNGVEYDAGSEILVTDGATLGIWSALGALLQAGDEVLLPDPVYDAYQSPIRLAGGTPRPVRSRLEDGRFALSAVDVDEACTSRTRVLLLNTPWNPTGTVFRTDELEAIAGVVVKRGLTLISDEIYEQIVYDGNCHVSPVKAVPELRSRCILVNSLSKTYAMTGWRAGYCAGPKNLIARMLLVLQQSSRGPATFVQDAAAAALSGPQQCVDEMRNEYSARRRRVINALSGIPNVKVLPPEGGFFAMTDVRELGIPSNDLRLKLLHDHGVVVVHGAAYGQCGEGTLRISFGSGGKALERGLVRLRDGLAVI